MIQFLLNANSDTITQMCHVIRHLYSNNQKGKSHYPLEKIKQIQQRLSSL